MNSIDPKYVSFGKLINGRLFSIPEYQRAYSWTSRQRSDLFSDIERTFSKGASGNHFMATMVCLRKGVRTIGVDDCHELEVVDGQQRLTTLAILLKAIALHLNPAESREATQRNSINSLLADHETGELLLLRTNHDDEGYFSNYIRKGELASREQATSLSDKALIEAFDECNKFVATWSKTKSSIELLALIRNRLHVLLHEISDEKSVYTVFEVLNSRGLDVSWLDRLKSILMGSAFDLPEKGRAALISDLRNCWANIYSTIGLRQGMSPELLKFSAALWSDAPLNRVPSESDAVDLFRASAEAGKAKSIRDIAEWLQAVTQACNQILSDRRLAAVSRIYQARLLAVAILLKKELSEQQRSHLMVKWEKISFRIYGLMRNDARTAVGEYVRLAWHIINSDMDFNQIHSGLNSIGKNYPIEDAVTRLDASDCYHQWGEGLRYFMYRREEFLSKKAGQVFSNEQWTRIWAAETVDSIEHILPQSADEDGISHRLGNLMLLPPKLNSSLQAAPVKENLNAYRRTGLLIADEAIKFIGRQGDWTEAKIAKREKALIDWARTEWAD